MSDILSTYDITKKEIKLLLNSLKASAKKRGIQFNLTTSDIDYIGIPISCPVLGIPIFFHKGKVKDDSISFDRIDSSKGYERDNVIIVSYRVNKIKSDASLQELNNIVNFYNDLSVN
jgi:hypothetical protein